MCDVCKNEIPLLISNDITIFIRDGKIVVDYDCDDGWYGFAIDTPIKFCPICGEKMEAKNEQ